MKAVSGVGISIIVGVLAIAALVVVGGRSATSAINVAAPADDIATDVTTDDPTDAAAERRNAAGYEAALETLLAHGGQVVAEGLRPGVADIANAAFDDDVLVRMATGWVASLEDIAADVSEIPVPTALAEVAAGYKRALGAYVRTAETLLDAARASGSARLALIDEASDIGRAADAIFDDAQAALDSWTIRPDDPNDDRRGN